MPEKFDYDKHCKYYFGEYVLVNNKPNIANNNTPRVLDYIFLRLAANAQDSHELFQLKTNKLTTRRICTPVPITTSIMKQARLFTKEDNIPEVLKITNKINEVLFDFTWIIGVDYVDYYEVNNYESNDERKYEKNKNEHRAYDEMD